MSLAKLTARPEIRAGRESERLSAVCPGAVGLWKDCAGSRPPEVIPTLCKGEMKKRGGLMCDSIQYANATTKQRVEMKKWTDGALFIQFIQGGTLNFVNSQQTPPLDLL